MKPITLSFASLLVLLSSLPASAFESVKQPILYPNAHYEVMGKEAAQADIDDCWMMARAAAAAVLGGDPGRGAVAGAVGGGVASMTAGMMAQNNPPRIFRGIVERCLFEKVYEVAGWE